MNYICLEKFNLRTYIKSDIKTIYKSSEEENTLTLAIDASKKVLNGIEEHIESLIFV